MRAHRHRSVPRRSTRVRHANRGIRAEAMTLGHLALLGDAARDEGPQQGWDCTRTLKRLSRLAGRSKPGEAAEGPRLKHANRSGLAYPDTRLRSAPLPSPCTEPA